MEHEILTPESRPDHETIGRKFRGPWGDIYYCDSYDRRIGFWMTKLDAAGSLTKERTNVSERAIGRTYHRIDW